MKTLIVALCLPLAAGWAGAEVRVLVEENHGIAWIKYECTSGEVVRAFALDVSVDQGRIVGISDFLRGLSTVEARGYGIFPSSFRDSVTVISGTEATWDADGYTPLANPADDPAGTLPGLDSSGVTLELGALWDPTMLGAVPGEEGTLCALRISEAAQVSVAANEVRGGILAASGEQIADPVFIGASVEPGVPVITGLGIEGDILTVTYENAELETAPAVDGPWSATGNATGVYSESIEGIDAKFYRVR